MAHGRSDRRMTTFSQARALVRPLAQTISVIFNPLVFCSLFFATLAVRHRPWAAPLSVLWTALVAAPALLLGFGMHCGWWSDLDVSQLHERRTYMPWVLASAGLAGALAWGYAFPSPLKWSIDSIFLWLAVSVAVGVTWKISLHAGSSTGILALAYLTLGWRWGLALTWIPIAVGWARVRLACHTPFQVLAGAVAGGAAVTVVWLVHPGI